MRNTMVGGSHNGDSVAFAPLNGGSELIVVVADAPTRVIQSHAAPLPRARGFTHFDQQELMVGPTSSQGSGSSAEGRACHIQADDIGVELDHGRHVANVEDIVT